MEEQGRTKSRKRSSPVAGAVQVETGQRVWWKKLPDESKRKDKYGGPGNQHQAQCMTRGNENRLDVHPASDRLVSIAVTDVLPCG